MNICQPEGDPSPQSPLWLVFSFSRKMEKMRAGGIATVRYCSRVPAAPHPYPLDPGNDPREKHQAIATQTKA